MADRRRVLFITPAATRSGAPMLLWHLVRWVNLRRDHELSAVLVSGGAMAATLSAEMPTAVFYDDSPAPSAPVRLLRRHPLVARRRAAARVARCRAVVGRWPPDVVYCNSAAAAAVLDALGPYTCPVVISLHEMEYALGRSVDWVAGGAMAAMSRHATHWIAGSRAVADNLVRRHGVPADRITVVHDFVTTADLPLPPLPPSDPALLAAAGIPGGAAVVGTIATAEWRKGADLFVALARLVAPADAAGRPVHFVWVGPGLSPVDLVQLRFDIDTAGLGDRVHAVGPTQRTADWYPAFTVFAMLSREDPFPLVALEAAACGLPVVCFADAGGVPELVEADAGRVVPFLDLAAFAAAVTELVDNPDLCRRLGTAGAEKVRARHDVTVAVPQVMACVDDQLRGR